MAEDLKDIVRRLREAANLTQEQLGEKIDRTGGAVAHWEVGRRGMSDDAVEEIAEALRLSTTDRRRLAEAAKAFRRTTNRSTAQRLTDLEAGIEGLQELVAELLRRTEPDQGER